MNKSTKSTVNEVSERIKNRRKEVEKIKAEIEKLINAGVGPVDIPNLTKQQLQKQQKLQELKQQQKKHVETVPETICSRNADNNGDHLLNAQRKVPVQKPEKQKSPPQAASSKSRPYDVVETREYIKKQREKRVQQTKNQINNNQNEIDLKKQRLKALQEKQRELVAKNIQVKRERSKSRDRNNQVRLDRTSRSTTRDKSRESPNVNLQKQHSEVVGKATKSQRVSNRNCDRSGDIRSNNHNIGNDEQEDNVVCGRLSRSRVVKTDLNRPESLFKNISIRKKQLVINNEDSDRVETDNLENANLVEKKPIENIVTIKDCGRETKETQTSLKSNNEPPLPVPQLQSQYYPPDPYNTINTFIRKLQFTSNEGKKFTDIGVQKSSRSSTIDKRQKIQDEIHELLNKNINNINESIFNQQENLNLNLDSVEKLKLVPSTSIKNRTRNVSKRLIFDNDNSESDTSKNIPEISSESGVSSSRSTVINSETNLDLERLENLKLQTNNHKKRSSDIVAKSTKSYSSDFIDEIKSKSDNSIVEQQNSVPRSTLNTAFCIEEPNDTTIVDNLEKSMHLQVPPLNLDVNVNKTRGDSILSTQNSSRSETENKSIISNQIPPTITIQANQNDTTNRIHLKFEAEVHLLNDYNQTFHRFRELEEAFEHLKRESFERIGTKKNNDTQTSFKTATTTTDREQQLSINFSRGSDINDNLSNNNNKSISTIPELELSSFNESANECSMNNDGSRLKTLINTDYDANNCAGLSLNMFEQLIKDEDARLKHLKTIIKIREQALLDRTKGELVWLEIQKKQLVETGKIEQASLIKKKQRAVLLKLEQERNEIKRLKQTQKQASNERINKLKQQRNLIKSQLSTNDMLTNIKITTPVSTTRKDRRHSGPLIVTQHHHKESTHSETSISTKRSGSGDDVLSITTTTSKISEVSSTIEHDPDSVLNLQDPTSNLHRNLSMREKALRERKKTAEELLKWHQKLLDEEKKITALELAANVLVKQIPNKNKKRKNNKELLLINNNDIDGDDGKIFEFNGKQLNQLWRNMSGRIEKTFIDDKHYIMSQIEFEKFCKSATKLTRHANKRNSNKNSETLKTLNRSTSTTISELSDERDIPITSGKSIRRNTKSISEDDIKTINGEYSSQFDSESVQEIVNIDNDVDENQITSISELIQNFSKIEDEISVLGKHQNSPEESQQNFSITEEIPIEPNSQNEKISEQITSSDNQSIELQQLENNLNTTEKITNEPSIEISENVINTITDNIFKIGDSIKEIDEKFDESLKILSTDSKISRANFESFPTINNKGDNGETVQEEITIENTQLHDLLSGKTEIIEEKTTKSEDVLTENTIDESTTLNQIVSNEVLNEEEIEKQESIETVKESEQYSDDFKSESKENSTIESKDEIIENETEDSQIVTITDDSSKETTKSTTTSQQIDVKKRVSEIMAETNTPLRSDKSPRLQDIYVTTYDNELLGASDAVKSEAEELLRKQIAIEQEIKQLEQQQKEQIPYLYMREIPNKPPPPYTPPSTLPVVQTILPTDPKQIDEITNYTSKVLYKAYELNNLENVKFSENSFKLISKLDIGKNCCELLFDICKDLAYQHYKQFKIIENEPVWMKVLNKKHKLSIVKPYDCRTLERYMNRKLKELFNFEKPQIQESMIIKWGRKKRDHVDEILIKESQEEDTQWTSFDKDELIVKDQLTDFIMNMLIDETVDIVKRIFDKRNSINFNVLEEAKDEY